MTPDEVADRRFHLLYKAEYSTRYHRRRATFLSNLDTLFSLVTVVAGASAFGALVAASPGWLSKIGAATVTIISLIQILLRLGPQASAHTQWLKRWNAMHADISLTSEATKDDITRWVKECAAIEDECVGELRALRFDCEDAAARVLEVPGRQHYIHPLQRIFIHFGTLQQKFPYVPDQISPLPAPKPLQHQGQPQQP